MLAQPGRARVAVIDDWQGVAAGCADWSALAGVADVEFFTQPFVDDDARVAALEPFDIIVPMRERTRLHGALLARLPRLRLLALTGYGLRHVDVQYCNEHGIVCCGSGKYSPAATAEFTLGLILAAVRHIPQAHEGMRAGDFQQRVPLGSTLEGRTLGIIGLGHLGSRVAAYGRALGMRVIGWSPHLTDERARSAGVECVTQLALLQQADVVSLHLVLSDSTRGILGAGELAAMKPGAVLVNTARGPLVDETALVAAVRSGHISAALDVYDEEPLSARHPLRSLPGVVLTPHLGFCTAGTFADFYGESIQNILAFLRGAPVRVVNAPAPPLV